MMLPEAAPQGWRSWGSFLRSLPLASSARTCIARPETPRTSAATESSLMPASSSVFWIRWHSAPCAWKGPLAVADKIPQLPNLRRGHEAAPQQPTLQQLA
jgi:hypothetical protein